MTQPSDDPNGEDFASLLAEYERDHPTTKRNRRGPEVGRMVRGRVVSIGQDAAFVDLGAKSEGMLDLAELRDEHGQVNVAVGDTIEARVTENDERTGCYILRRTLGRGPEARAELERAYQMGIPVEGVISGLNKGGVEVQIAGVRAFCPISQLAVHHVDNAGDFVGQRHQFRITRLEPGRGRDLNLVVSRRALLEEEARRRAAETRARLHPGSVVRGTVATIKDYGAFVDLGGIEGMLHRSEIGHAHINHPNEVLRVGQELEVQILKIEKTDDPRRPERVALSLKALAANPWDDIAPRLAEGSEHTGTVERLETYGAFVELVPGVEGLLHISELGAGRPLRHAREALKPGQRITVTVLGVDAERRRVSLGLARTKDSEDTDAGDVAGTAVAETTRFGTLGDLLKGKKK